MVPGKNTYNTYSSRQSDWEYGVQAGKGCTMNVLITWKELEGKDQ